MVDRLNTRRTDARQADVSGRLDAEPNRAGAQSHGHAYSRRHRRNDVASLSQNICDDTSDEIRSRSSRCFRLRQKTPSTWWRNCSSSTRKNDSQSKKRSSTHMSRSSTTLTTSRSARRSSRFRSTTTRSSRSKSTDSKSTPTSIRERKSSGKRKWCRSKSTCRRNKSAAGYTTQYGSGYPKKESKDADAEPARPSTTHGKAHASFKRSSTAKYASASGTGAAASAVAEKVSSDKVASAATKSSKAAAEKEKYQKYYCLKETGIHLFGKLSPFYLFKYQALARPYIVGKGEWDHSDSKLHCFFILILR